MSQQEFESYLRLLCRFLHLSGDQREAIARELRAHMEDRLEELLSRGYTREEAIQTALDEFGDAAALAGDFGHIGRKRRIIMRTTTATIGIAAAVLMVSFLLPEHRPLVPAPAWTHADPPAAHDSEKTEPDAVPGPESLGQDVVAKRDPFGRGGLHETPADIATRQKLSVVLPRVEFPEGTGLAEEIDFIKSATNTSIDVNWPALARANVERTTDTGGMSLLNAKAETALAKLLNRLNSVAEGSRISYDIVDGIISISTEDDLFSHVVVRVYDVHDLTDAMAPLSTTEKEVVTILVRNLGPQTRPADDGTQESQKSDARMATTVTKVVAEMREQNAARLMKAITTTIEPNSWSPDGSRTTLGSLDFWNNRLIVRHTPTVHQQIKDLLQQMREQPRAAAPTAEPGTKRSR